VVIHFFYNKSPSISPSCCFLHFLSKAPNP
jgi:hypothetical protein